jgi:hypothetical protein
MHSPRVRLLAMGGARPASMAVTDRGIWDKMDGSGDEELDS